MFEQPKSKFLQEAIDAACLSHPGLREALGKRRLHPLDGETVSENKAKAVYQEFEQSGNWENLSDKEKNYWRQVADAYDNLGFTHEDYKNIASFFEMKSERNESDKQETQYSDFELTEIAPYLIAIIVMTTVCACLLLI